MWIICTILTVTNALPVGHPARADSKLKIIYDSPWFRIPYPGQWGIPTVTLSGVLGMLAGVLACTVESISYYPTTSKMCGKIYRFANTLFKLIIFINIFEKYIPFKIKIFIFFMYI